MVIYFPRGSGWPGQNDFGPWAVSGRPDWVGRSYLEWGLYLRLSRLGPGQPIRIWERVVYKSGDPIKSRSHETPTRLTCVGCTLLAEHRSQERKDSQARTARSGPTCRLDNAPMDTWAAGLRGKSEGQKQQKTGSLPFHSAQLS